MVDYRARARRSWSTTNASNTGLNVMGNRERLMTLTEGDGFEAFSRVATPGGFTEKVHNMLFSTPWPLQES